MNKIFILSCLLIITLSAKCEICPLSIDGADATLVGIQITEISTGKTTYEYNANMSFIPASVMKAVTTASVMSEIDNNYKFETKVFAIGNIVDSVLTGDIIIDGVGDPTINSRHFPNNCNFVDNIVKVIQYKGIRILNSKLQCKSSLREEGIAPHWQVEDVAWGYGAGLYGVNYRDNTFDYYTKKDSMYPALKNVKIYNLADYGKDDPILVRGLNSNEITITGTIPNRSNYKIECAIPHPEDVLWNDIVENFDVTEGLDEFQCLHNNIDTILLYKHYSPPLKKIMRSLMVRSDNLYAESVLRLLAKNRTRTSAIKNEINMWQNRGIETKYISINDGCGLSRINKLTPKFISDIMLWMAQSEHCDEYVSLFPRAGKDGTLRNFLRNTRLTDTIVLKTGSMKGIQTYAGYKLNTNGQPTHTIVIMVNSFFCKRHQLIKEIERLMLQIF